MTTTTGRCLLVSALLAGQAAHGATLQIDVLPGEHANLVDLQGDTPVTVAVLGSAELDVRSVDVGSLRLSGAALAKDAEGRTHVLKDVDADGYLDLVVHFAARQMRLGMHDTAALLGGKALDGRPLRGSGKVQVLEAVLAAAMPSSSAEEKEAPLQVQLASDPSGGSRSSRSAGLMVTPVGTGKTYRMSFSVRASHIRFTATLTMVRRALMSVQYVSQPRRLSRQRANLIA